MMYLGHYYQILYTICQKTVPLYIPS